MSSDRQNPAIFLDRDGVLNEDRVNYAYDIEHFKVLPGVTETLVKLNNAGFILIVVTNQSGIAQNIYTVEQMKVCHQYLQKLCSHSIDHFYYSPLHPSVSASLMRKPNSLMFEKAIAKFNIDISSSWMIGDKERDIIPAQRMGIKTIRIGETLENEVKADYMAPNLPDASVIILNHQK